MIGNQTPPPREILTDSEQAALGFAQELYAGQAKIAAHGLAQAVGLGEPATGELIAGIDTRLVDLNFEQRREVAFSLRAVAQALHGGPVEVARPLKAAELEATPIDTIESAGSDKLAASLPSSEYEHTTPLGRAQRTIVSQLLGSEHLERVAGLAVEQRVAFIRALGNRYQGVRTPRLSSDAKVQITENLVAIMQGKTYTQLAAEQGRSVTTLHSSMLNAVSRIAQQLAPDEIADLLPAPGASPDETASGEPSSHVGRSDSEAVLATARTNGAKSPDNVVLPLTRTQVTWYRRFAEEQMLKEVEQFTAAQREFFGNRLGAYLSAVVIRREGQAATERRIQNMGLFICKGEVRLVAEATDQPVQEVRSNLLSTSFILHRQLPGRDLKKIIDETVQQPTE